MACRDNSRVTEVPIGDGGQPLADPNAFCLGDRLFARDGSTFTVVFGPGGLAFRPDEVVGLYTIYMSPAGGSGTRAPGNDANPGTLARPVLTLPRALDLVPCCFQDSVIIDAAAGTYPPLDPVPVTPGDDTVQLVLTIGSPATSGHASEQVSHHGGNNIVLAGDYAALATFAVAAANPDGDILDTGVAMVADLYLGAVVEVIASTNPSIVGVGATVFENTVGGQFRLAKAFLAFGPVPPGTVFVVMRPSAVFPYNGNLVGVSTDYVFDMTGDEFMVVGCKFQRLGTEAVRLQATTGSLRMLAGEVALGTGDSSIKLDSKGSLGTGGLHRLPRKFDDMNGVPPADWDLAGTHIHRDTIGIAVSAYDIAGVDFTIAGGLFSRASVWHRSVLQLTTSQMEFFGVEFVESQAIAQGGYLLVDNKLGGFSRDAPGSAFAVAEGVLSLRNISIDGFTQPAVVTFGRSSIEATAVIGTGAAGSQYGFVLQESSFLRVEAATVFLAGDAAAGGGAVLLGQRPLSYAELAAAGGGGIVAGIQAGTATLDGGTPASVAVPAFILGGGQRINVTPNTPAGGGPGIYSAPDLDRIAGSPTPDGLPPTGQFTIRSSVNGDTSTVDWTVIDDVQTLCRAVSQ